jgi:hypothetical protein
MRRQLCSEYTVVDTRLPAWREEQGTPAASLTVKMRFGRSALLKKIYPFSSPGVKKLFHERLVQAALNTQPVITHSGGSRFGVRRHDAAFRIGIQQHESTKP